MGGVESVAAVITTFQRSQTLQLAIASALCQSPYIKEIVVVDDNCDETHAAEAAEVVESFQNSRLKYVRNPANLGVAASRNVGIRRAASEHVAFLDDDDYWLPGKLKAQLRSMEPGIVGVDCGFVEKDDCGTLLAIHGDGRAKDQLQMLRGYCPVSASFVLVRRAAAIQAGLFDETILGFEDYDFWLRCAAFGKFANVPDPICVYVQHSGYRMSSTSKRFEGLEQVIDKWRPKIGGEREVEDFRKRWRAIQYATNSRRALGVSAKESLASAFAALQELPGHSSGWAAVLWAVLGLRVSRSLRRLRHSRLVPSQALVNSMRKIEALASPHLCPASTPMRQIHRVKEGRISGSS